MLRVHVRTALSSLFAQKLRAFLAMLGVLVGTTSVVALVSSGRLASLHAIEQFRALGTNLLSVSIRYHDQMTSSPRAQHDLQLAEVNQLAKAIPNILDIAPYIRLFLLSPPSYKGKRITNTLVATTGSLQAIVKLGLAKGRFISSLDRHNYYCVIGAEVEKKLRQQGVFDPIGAHIRVNDRYLQIVGVAKPWPENIFLSTNLNKAIIVPIELAHQLSQYATIRQILFRIKPDATHTVQGEIRNQLSRYLPNVHLFFRSPEQIIARMIQQKKTFSWLLGLIGSISLLVGGIGIMNIMLVSVVERKREIGLRLAIGARQRDIQAMFLCEATALTLIGGVLGVILGLVVTLIIAIMAGWHFYILPSPILVGFVVSVLVGLFFGFYPARRASRLNPSEALRAD